MTQIPEENLNIDKMVKKEITYLVNGTFEFVESRLLLKNIKTKSDFKLEPLMAEILSFLITNRSRVIQRQELITKFWNSDIFGDEALTKIISKIRKGLKDDSREPKYIRTLNKVGYEWIGEVEIKLTAFQQITRQAFTLQFSRRTVVGLSLIVVIIFAIKSIFLPHH